MTTDHSDTTDRSDARAVASPRPDGNHELGVDRFASPDDGGAAGWLGRTLGAARAVVAATAVLGVIAVAAETVHPQAARAAPPVTVDANYRVSYGALSIGHLVTSTRIEGNRYALEGAFASGGVAKIFSKTNGTAEATGRLGKNGVRPETFALAYRSGEKKRARRIAFAGDRVSDVALDPEPKKRDDWVDVKPEDLLGVLDPAAGLIVAGKGTVCGRTLKTFDGRMRLDVRMSPRKPRPFRAEGFRGTAQVCSLRFEPVSGYKKDKDSIEEMRDLKGAEAMFVSLPGTDAWQLVGLTVPTSIGKVSARATRFEVSG